MSLPLFVRRLTRGERVNTKRLRRTPPSIGVGLRAQAVPLSRQGHPVQEIRDIVGRNRSTAFRWLQAFDTCGLDSLRPGTIEGEPVSIDEDSSATHIGFEIPFTLDEGEHTFELRDPSGGILIAEITFRVVDPILGP